MELAIAHPRYFLEGDRPSQTDLYTYILPLLYSRNSCEMFVTSRAVFHSYVYNVCFHIPAYSTQFSQTD